MGGQGASRLRQRGAALLDLVVSAAVALMIFGFLVGVLHTMTAAAGSRHAAMLARTDIEQLLERMRAEATSAWSISVPATDVHGENNADGHEIDFTTQDAARRLFHWAYCYDAASKTLTRYAIASGASPQAAARIASVTAFSGRAFPATEVSVASSAIYDPLFASTTVTPVAYALSDGSVAGNGFVLVAIAGANTSESELLATTVAPTQFTVVVQYTPPPQ